MTKKIIHIIRFAVIGILWSYVFLISANYITYFLWNFNFMSFHSWKVIADFWDSGGIIKTAKDYSFFAFLVILPIIWILGWKYLLKKNYLNMFFYPIIAYNNHIIKKYDKESSRVVLKNVKSSQKIIEEIKEQIESIKPEKTTEANNIRSSVIKKLEQTNKKD